MLAAIIRRNLFTTLALVLGLVPASASAATVELMSLRAIKVQESDGDEIQLRLSADNGAETVLNRTMNTSQPWLISSTFSYSKSVRVRLLETDAGTAVTILGNTVLTTKAGIYEAPFTLEGAHYVLVYLVVPTAPAPTPPSYVLQLKWLQAVKTQEGGGDEILFKFSSDGGKTNVLSRTMRTGNVWNINKDIPFVNKAPINIYDEDLAFDDLLGGKTFTPKDFNIAYQTAVFQNSDGTRYILSYRVLRK